MSRIRCGIKTAKLGATVFGRRKPISKDWWKGVWPLEDEEVEPSQSSKQNTPIEDEEVEPSQSINQNAPTANEEGCSAVSDYAGNFLILVAEFFVPVPDEASSKCDQLAGDVDQEDSDAC